MLRLILMLALSAIAAASMAAETAPEGWSFRTVRDETAARSEVRKTADAQSLVISGNGEAISDGRWVKRVPLPQGEYANFAARFRATNVETIARSVVASLVWLDESGKELSNAEFAITTAAPDAQGWRQINEIYKTPAKAKQAQIELRT